MNQRRTNQASRALLVIGASALAPLASAQDTGHKHELDQSTIEKIYKEPGYSPYAGRNYPSQVYWGNQHHHTAISLDAAAIGCKLDDEASYRFARGEEVVSSTGQRVRLSRPIDWLVVSDHAEAYGSITELLAGNPTMLADPTLKRWHDMIKGGGKPAYTAAWEIIHASGDRKLPAPATSKEVTGAAWERHVKIAEKYNEPGRFTAFHGYEWTSMPDGDNIHRNVVFRDNADRVMKTYPFSALESENPEDLWKVLADYEEKTGGKALAIPHNPNISAGRMFKQTDSAGKPFSPEYVAERARWEVLLEVVQTKGQSETAPYLSPNDEFADFEVWDKMNLGGNKLHQDSYYEGEYARAALKQGLKLKQALGSNPFKFGMIGGTDQHLGMTAIEEENYFGMSPLDEPKKNRIGGVFLKNGDVQVTFGEASAAGYGAIWATENTREALWDAMKRKETYATTGTRMIVRFFGGWEFEQIDAETRNPANAGYTKGVPMGGDLPAAPKPGEGGTKAPEGKSPSFLLAAMKDPIGANLDRIQVVKGWTDANGDTQEKVYDVVWGDAESRKPGDDGKLPPVGNTVNAKEAYWLNTIGDPELITVWKDPEFDPKQHAFYYARVIEIPTPRWTTYDAKRFNEEIPKEIPASIQERAYTSPIWYTP